VRVGRSADIPIRIHLLRLATWRCSRSTRARRSSRSWRRLDERDRATELAATAGRSVGFTLATLGLAGVAAGVLGWFWLSPLATPIAAFVRNHPGLLAAPTTTTVTELVERPAFVAAGRAVVVDAGGRPVGLLSRTDVVRTVRATSPRGPGDRAGAIVGG
jgi:hypothetical protein